MNRPPVKEPYLLDYYSILTLVILCYLMECFVVTDGNPVLITRVGMHWRVFRNPGFRLGNGKRLLPLNPLPFLAEWHLARQLACTPTEMGLLPRASLYPDDIPAALDNDSSMEAACRANLLESGLLAEIREKSEQAIDAKEDSEPEFPSIDEDIPAVPVEAWSHWADPAPFKTKREAVLRIIHLLQILCSLQCILYFGALPFFFVLYYPSVPGMLLYVACMYLLSLIITALFIRAWRKAIPSGSGLTGKAASMLLYPPASIRAIQKLSPAVDAARHESAIALTLMGKGKTGRDYISRVIRLLKYRLFEHSLGSEEANAIGKTNEYLIQAIARHWDVDPAGLTRASRPEPGARCQCPVCGISLTTMPEYCPHCREVRPIQVEVTSTL